VCTDLIILKGVPIEVCSCSHRSWGGVRSRVSIKLRHKDICMNCAPSLAGGHKYSLSSLIGKVGVCMA
jgi:hypothetical protein